MINRQKLAELNARELETFAARNPKSKAAYERADHLFGRVPMTWMNKKAGGFPVYFDRAQGTRFGISTETSTSTSRLETPVRWRGTRTRLWSKRSNVE